MRYLLEVNILGLPQKARFPNTALKISVVAFDGEKISQGQFSDVDDRENLTEISAGMQTWRGWRIGLS